MPRYREQFLPAEKGDAVWVVEDSICVESLTSEQKENLVDDVIYVNILISVIGSTSRASYQEKQEGK